MNQKEKELAKKIVIYSLKIKKDDKVLITYQDIKTTSFVKSLLKEIQDVGAIGFVVYDNIELSNYLKETTTKKRIELLKKYNEFELGMFDVFINIKYTLNDYEGKNIDPKITKEILKETYESHNKMVNERRWILLNYPSVLDAYKAKTTIEDFYDFSMNVMSFDYKTLEEYLMPLKKLMKKTDQVRITSPGTDLTFSIKGMPIIPCVGGSNLPDGEIYTAPLKKSVNGYITYNTSSTYRGEVFSGVKLEFENGKIINASCEQGSQERLLEIFSTDEGSRYVGEFSLGLNPLILQPMGDILYDEKIIGSIHFTPGAAYKDSYNGNDSTVHWDLVLIQRSDYGGGEIYFDDQLIRKDGLFIPEELQPLNYNLSDKKKDQNSK